MAHGRYYTMNSRWTQCQVGRIRTHPHICVAGTERMGLPIDCAPCIHTYIYIYIYVIYRERVLKTGFHSVLFSSAFPCLLLSVLRFRRGVGRRCKFHNAAHIFEIGKTDKWSTTSRGCYTAGNAAGKKNQIMISGRCLGVGGLFGVLWSSGHDHRVARLVAESSESDSGGGQQR